MGHKTRWRKDSKNPSGYIILEGAREGKNGGIRSSPASREPLSQTIHLPFA
jgi:hypothetical protein